MNREATPGESKVRFVVLGARAEALREHLSSSEIASARQHDLGVDVSIRAIGADSRLLLLHPLHVGEAEAPGAETRATLASASLAQAAVVLVDAVEGLDSRARRDTYLAWLAGARRLVLVVDHAPGASWSVVRFETIERQWRDFAQLLGATDTVCIAAETHSGANVSSEGPSLVGHNGPTLLQCLAAPAAAVDRARSGATRVLVHAARERECEASVVRGTVRRGDRVRVQPSGGDAQIAGLVGSSGSLAEAAAGTTLKLELTNGFTVARGDVLCAIDAPAQVADQFECTIIWTDDHPMMRGRSYSMRIGEALTTATITPLKHRVNPDTLERMPAAQLEHGEIGVCDVALDQPVAFDPYDRCARTGRFVLLDRMTGAMAGIGLIHFALRRSQNLHWQAIDIDKRAHAAIKAQKPCVIWFTGLSGAGKSTVANLLEKRLYALGRHTYTLDGDNVRHGLNRDLGFKEADRVENIRRVAEVAKLMVDAGLITLVSFISPFRSERQMARDLVELGEFIEVYVSTPLAVAEARDPKGLYRKARRGELLNFTGIDSPYEPPEHPELTIDTTSMAPDEAVERILAELERRGILR